MATPFDGRMASVTSNLNDLSSEDDHTCRKKRQRDFTKVVCLLKDGKLISHTECIDPPENIPNSWDVFEIKRISDLPTSGLPQFRLRFASDNSHERMEWKKFLDHIAKYKRAAVVPSPPYIFYILPPDMGTNFIDAVVLWTEDAERAMNLLNKRLPDNLKKNFIRSDASFLKTSAQIHGWIFGAIAELVDNSRDAKATRLDISIEELYSKKDRNSFPVIEVIDNGHGMSYQELLRMLSYGHKKPDEDDPNHIGRFGVGFKTGAMKLGRDAIVLTQTKDSRSIGFLSQSFNQGKDNVEAPIVSYIRRGSVMELDTTVHSKTSEKYYKKAIKEYSPFDEYLIGEKLGLFHGGTGTQIYIWNLYKSGDEYALEWTTKNKCTSSSGNGDIFIRSRRARMRPGQYSKKVPLDYSLQSYLEVIFLDPRMKMFVQGSLVKARPLAKSLNNTVVLNKKILGKFVQLTLGRCQVEFERYNSGMFLYWHGRLIEAYKRVGNALHNTDDGRGVIGVIDVSDLMYNGEDAFVLNNKQGFEDCEEYAILVDWLGEKLDEYWDTNFNALELRTGSARYKPDHEWVQCDKCRKWRILDSDFDTTTLPSKWFCCMPPYEGKCDDPEMEAGHGVITVGEKRSVCHEKQKKFVIYNKTVNSQQQEEEEDVEEVDGRGSSSQTVEDKVVPSPKASQIMEAKVVRPVKSIPVLENKPAVLPPSTQTKEVNQKVVRTFQSSPVLEEKPILPLQSTNHTLNAEQNVVRAVRSIPIVEKKPITYTQRTKSSEKVLRSYKSGHTVQENLTHPLRLSTQTMEGEEKVVRALRSGRIVEENINLPLGSSSSTGPVNGSSQRMEDFTALPFKRLKKGLRNQKEY